MFNHLRRTCSAYPRFVQPLKAWMAERPRLSGSAFYRAVSSTEHHNRGPRGRRDPATHVFEGGSVTAISRRCRDEPARDFGCD